MEAIPEAHMAALRELYGSPEGTFHRGRDAVTYYHLEEPQKLRQSKIAVLANGLGNSTKVYDGFRRGLLAAGFRVLRYDYPCHGWSYAAEDVCLDKDCLLNQLEEVLGQVLGPNEPVDLFVGFSTGGLLGVLAACALERPIVRLALISPAFWKQAPVIVKVADRLPSLLLWLSKFKSLRLVEDGYLENCDNAFAHEGKKYFFADKHETARQDIIRMFEKHPSAKRGIAQLLVNVLRLDLLEEAIPQFQWLIKQREESHPSIGLFWGSHDMVVETKHSQAVLGWPGADRSVRFFELKGLGHESPLEDPEYIVRQILLFVGHPHSAL